jgi:hypothetical protein
MTGSGGEAAVAGQQRRVERFGERDISGVIGYQIVRNSQTRGSNASCW